MCRIIGGLGDRFVDLACLGEGEPAGEDANGDVGPPELAADSVERGVKDFGVVVGEGRREVVGVQLAVGSVGLVSGGTSAR